MTTETGYKITKQGQWYETTHGATLISKGCLTVEDSLQSIWKHEGSDPQSKFFMHNDIVIKSRDL